MKVAIVGGGPAGLYFGILFKKAHPESDITVFERNKPDDTFGFGVVFSDETLDTFESWDQESYRRITEEFAYWDDIEINYKGTKHRVGGNGFCGCSRFTLLDIRESGLHIEARPASGFSEPIDHATLPPHIDGPLGRLERIDLSID